MAILASLKLVSAKRNSNASPTIQRRNKLLKQLSEQIHLATAQAEGRVYAPTKLKKSVDTATGESVTAEVVKQVKQWWATDESGKLNLFVRYGAKVLPLGKNTNAIEVPDSDQLVDTLKVIKQAVEAGELDAAIEAASAATRKQFK